MNALSLLNPWACLVAIGAKRIETRPWSTDYRGPLAIHSSRRFPRPCKDKCWQAPFQDVLFWRGTEAGMTELFNSLEHLPCGQVLATCELVDVVPTFDAGLPSKRMPAADSNEYAFGNYEPGRFMFFLENVKMLAKPVPAKGRLGFWPWDERKCA